MHLLTWRNFGWLMATIILPAFFSAFGPEIRRFFVVLRGKPREWLLARRKQKLRQLERMHDSAYNLLLHFIWNIVYSAQFLLGYVVSIAFIRLYKPNVGGPIPLMVWSVFGAGYSN